MFFPGWAVARGIPLEALMGLASGQYKLYGGVIRWAAGTANAGQIVAHLLPVNPLSVIPGLDFIPGIVANLQLHDLQKVTKLNTQTLAQLSSQVTSLTQSTEHIFQVAAGTAALSGLGLVVSSVGFIAINNKLNLIDEKLKEIQKDVQAIKYFLESSERAKLFSALSEILKIDHKTAPEHRHTILHNARNTLSAINMRYRELLGESSTIETAMAHEEYYALTALALARCTAELGMFDIAQKEIVEMNIFWQCQARRIAKDIILGEHPERFFATDFVDNVSVTELSEWIDFASGESLGILQIDALRRKINERWYSQGWFSNDSSGLNGNKGIGLDKELSMLIPALRKLIARSSILEGYVAQYELLDQQRVKPSELEAKLANLPESQSISGYYVLEPAVSEEISFADLKSAKNQKTWPWQPKVEVAS